MTRVLITGIAGFTGRYVAAKLAERGHQVHGIVHSASDNLDGVERTYEADIADLSAVVRITQEVRPDYAVHLAGIAFVAHGEVDPIYRSNVVGTRHFLEALSALDRPPRSVLLSSSANVYGNSREGNLDEDAGFFPTNDYAVSKVALEYVASLYKSRLPLTVVRPFNYTGVGQSEKFLVPKIVAHARSHRSTIELGNVDIARDFSDVRSVAEIYARLLHEKNAIGKTFNVCSGNAVTLRELLDTVSRLTGHHFDIVVNPALIRTNEVRVLRGSKVRLECVIGPIPGISLESTLEWMLSA